MELTRTRLSFDGRRQHWTINVNITNFHIKNNNNIEYSKKNIYINNMYIYIYIWCDIVSSSNYRHDENIKNVSMSINFLEYMHKLHMIKYIQISLLELPLSLWSNYSISMSSACVSYMYSILFIEIISLFIINK